jgi:hypothetical protein
MFACNIFEYHIPLCPNVNSYDMFTNNIYIQERQSTNLQYHVTTEEVKLSKFASHVK